MGFVPGDAEERLEALEKRLDSVVRRIEALERLSPVVERAGSGVTIPGIPGEARVSIPPIAVAQREEPSNIPIFLGRSCLFLGGAFLLRLATQSGAVPGWVGALAAIVYALGGLVLADRDLARGAEVSAGFHVSWAALVLFPLVFEGATRFGLLSPVAAAGVLAIFTISGAAVAVRRSFRSITWILAPFALVVPVVLLFRTEDPFAAPIFLVLLAAGGLWAWNRLGWYELAWGIVLPVDFVLLLLVGLLATGSPTLRWLDGSSLVRAGLGLVAISFGFFLRRVAIEKLPVTPFQVTQSAVVWLAVFEPSVALASPGGRLWGGMIALLISTSFLAATLSLAGPDRTETEQPRGRYGFCVTIGALFLAEASRLLLPVEVVPFVWGALGVVAVLIPETRQGFGRRTLDRLAIGFAVAALVSRGPAGWSTGVWLLPEKQWWGISTAVAASLIVCSGLVYLMIARREVAAAAPRVGVFERAIPLAFLVAVLGAVAIRIAAPLFESAGGESPNLAVVRTVVLSVSALLLAVAFRSWRLPESFWLARFAVLAGGIKLVFVDLRSDRPAPVVVSLVVYGLGLMLTTRMIGVEKRN